MIFKRLTAIFTAMTLFLSGCSGFSGKRNLTYTDTLFDTVISVQILDIADEELIKGCEEICKKYDVMFSRTNENGEIYKINNAGGEAVEVSQDTITIIEKGIYYSEMSRGAFDITIGAVSTLWDFKSEEHKVPSKQDVRNAKSHVDYNNIYINENRVQLGSSKMQIDVGALAKGYIADRLKDYLIENGVKHALINLGGNVLAIGSKADGSDFNIGIQKPFDETGEPVTSVKISDHSVVTTGIYQRYFEREGKLYHHILDPKTGYPCENNLHSVTIITDSSLTADALSTTCFLLGYEKGMRLVDQLDNVDAVFITDDNEIHYSKNFLKKN